MAALFEFSVAKELFNDDEGVGTAVVELVFEVGVPSRMCDFFFPKKKAIM